MPTYEYKCDKCGALVVVLGSLNAQDVLGTTPHKCGGALKRIFSTFSFVMK